MTTPQPSVKSDLELKRELAGIKHTPVLTGGWRHSNGMIFCGSLRIAKADFDTNPHPDFCARLFDDICKTMNAAQNV